MAEDFFYSGCFKLTLVYLLMVHLLPKLGLKASYDANKPSWKAFMFYYNLLMSVYSALTFVGTSYYLSGLSFYSDDCQLHARQPMLQWIYYLFYLSKFVEYMDTAFLIVRGVPISWLQYIHHIGAAINIWGGIRYGNECTWIFVFFNSFIHALMYYYYAHSIYGKKVLPRIVITSLQILQFLTGFSFLYFYVHVTCYVRSPALMLGGWYLTYCYVGTVLMLFLNFFLRAYIVSGKKKRTAKEA